MKKHFGIILCGLLAGLLFETAAIAKDMSMHSVVERVQGLEENTLGRFSLGGLLEAEAGAAWTDVENTSDIVLATAALGVNIDIIENVTGDLLFLYREHAAEPMGMGREDAVEPMGMGREDDTESMDLEEGFITVDFGDVQSLLVSAGKMYVPFGNFESHFVSDPLTMKIGETNQSALSVTFASEVVAITGAVFNGDVDVPGDKDLAESFAFQAVFTMPEDTMKKVGMTAGASLITNLADSDGLEGKTPGEVASQVAGFNVFAGVSYMDRYFLEIEYIGALDEFDAGELTFDGGNAFAPEAWNLEAAMAVSDAIELAVKYEAGKDLGTFLPEDRYGVAGTWRLSEYTRLAAEYLHSEFAAGDSVDAARLQLAVEF